MSALAEHWTLDPDVTFLNHGSFGATPRTVLAHQAELRARMEREPVRFFCTDLEPMLDTVREELAGFLGADADDLAFVPNATTGVNAVLRSMSFAPGDELLVTSHAYGACKNALHFVADRAGAEVVVVEIPVPVSGPDAAVDAVLAAVTDRTRLALLDHVTSPTGLVMPLATLAERLAARDVSVLVDGAHGPGQCEVDLPALGALGVGYYTGNCHKWLCAPKGAGFLWVRRDLRDSVRPTVIGHGAAHSPELRPRFRQEFDWTGTDDPTAILCVGESIRAVAAMVPGGWDEVRRRNHALALEAHALLPERLVRHGVTPVGPAEMVGSMVGFMLPDGDPGPLATALTIPAFQQRLIERGVQVPVHPWPRAPRRVLRTSSHLYNSREQLETLVGALDELLG